MLTILALTLKKTITLLMLVGPVSTIPIFLSAASELDIRGKQQFAKTIALSVTIALLIATFLGVAILELLGVSIGAMQIGGGIIVFLLAIAMVLGKETSFKSSDEVKAEVEIRPASIVPVAIPMLAGPAAFSYVMGNSAWHSYWDLIHMIVPVLIVGFICWLNFHLASQAQKNIRQATMDVIERVGGFFIAAMAIEMIAAGLRAMFPMLVG